MDRQLIYPGATPLETDLLGTNRNMMVGNSKLAEALLGPTTQYEGFTVTPNPVPNLSVLVAPGTVYSKQAIDASAFSTMPADLSHQILKQGLSLDALGLNLPAPTTAGQSLCYLVQVSLAEIDTDMYVLPYYNASNPNVAFSGPANSGTAQPTKRKSIAVLSAVPGVPASTGTQIPPSPTFGAVGIAVVTVNYGDTTILAGAIVSSANTPVIQRLSNFAPINSPTFTGIPRGPTPLSTDSSNQLATTQMVQGTVAANAPNLSGYATNTALNSAVSGLATHSEVSNAVSGLASQGFVNNAVAAGFANSLNTNGYQRLPSGLIMQWGTYTGTTDNADIGFPIAFPSACFNVQCTANTSYASSSQNTQAFNVTNTKFTIFARSNERPTFWFAIGV
jgi:hypothetical protein